MNVAVVHDILDVRGGAERLMLTLAEAFSADFYTTRCDPAKTFDLDGVNVKLIKPFKYFRFKPKSLLSCPLEHILGMFGMYMLNLDKTLNRYDVVITSGKLGVFARGKKTIWYCHSPARFLYDLRDYTLDYLEEDYGKPVKTLARAWWYLWKGLDRSAAKRPDVIVANSRNVRERIMRYYGRDSVVINPPVRMDKFRNRKPEDYFLSVQRPNIEKGIELQLDAFGNLKDEKLVMVGDFINENYKRKLENRVRKLNNVKWIKSVDDEKLVDLYSRCKAVIQTSVNEDFGMVPLEAMASGKPVIAVNEGGFRETILDGRTGVLVRKPYEKNIPETVRNFRNSDFRPKACRERAECFSEEKFIAKMRELVECV